MSIKNFIPRPKKRDITISTDRLFLLALWSYNYGKNDGTEASFKREFFEKMEKLK